MLYLLSNPDSSSVRNWEFLGWAYRHLPSIIEKLRQNFCSMDWFFFINGIEGNRIVKDSWFYHTVLLWNACGWVSEDSFLFAFSQGLHLRKTGSRRKDAIWGGKRFYTVHGGTDRRKESENWDSAACKRQRQTETDRDFSESREQTPTPQR